MSGNTYTVAPDTLTSQFSFLSLFGVHGRIAVVTGGGSGLGSYTALALALHGAKVYVVGRRKEKLDEVVNDFGRRKAEEGAPKEAKDGQVIALPGDVSSKESILKLTEDYGKHEQHLNILINNAGIARHGEKADKDDGAAVLRTLWEEEWDNFTESYGVNVVGVHYCTLGFAPFLDKAPKPSHSEPGPVVLNVASIAGLHISRGAPISYQTSKDAVIKLSSILAGRFIPLQIRVNAICPGVFPSEMTSAVLPSDYDDVEHKMHDSIKAHPLKRSGTVQDFAGLILFLTSRAGAYLNGSTLVIDGGRLLTVSAA